MKRTKAIEILENRKAPYELLSFKASEYTAEEAARELDIPMPQVFKTLLAQSEKAGHVFAVVPGDQELSLKKLAAALGEKKAAMADLSNLTRLTGYQKGGCSPLGAKRRFPVFIDSTACSHPFIVVSAGLRGLQIKIAPQELAQAAGAEFAELC